MAASYPIKTVPISKIRDDGSTQFRKLQAETVEHYTALLTDGVELGSPTLFFDGADYWVGDGHHRVAAAKKAGVVELGCEVRPGTHRDAKLYALTEANSRHGLPLTAAERSGRVDVILADPEWSRWPETEIAKRCGVSRQTVWRRKQRVEDLQAAKALGGRHWLLSASPSDRHAFFEKASTKDQVPAWTLLLAAAGWPEDRIARFTGVAAERVRFILSPPVPAEDDREAMMALCETDDQRAFVLWWFAWGVGKVYSVAAWHAAQALRLAESVGLDRLTPTLSGWYDDWDAAAKAPADAKDPPEEFLVYPDPKLPDALEEAVDAFYWGVLDRTEMYVRGEHYTEEAAAA